MQPERHYFQTTSTPGRCSLLLFVTRNYLSIKRMVGLICHGPFDTSMEDGRSNERLRRIALTAATAALAKILAMAVPLVTITLALEYLGKEVYGLWMTITAFFSMFVFADFGLGSGLLTTLSRAYGRDDIEESRKLTSSTFFLLILVACVILVVFGVLFLFVPWAKILNANTEKTARLSVVLVAAIFLPQVIQLPFVMVQRTQLALQEGYWTNLWQCGASLTSIAFVILITKLRLGEVTLVLAVASIPAMVFFLNWCWFFLLEQKQLRPRWAARSRAKSVNLVQTGGAYCLLAILTTFGLAVDNVIVAHVCGLEEVSMFSIVSRVASLLTMTLGMICMPMWAANGEALARGDFAWVRRMTRRVVTITMSLAFLGGTVLVLLGPWVFRLWLGQSFEVSRLLLLGFAGRELMLSMASPFFMVLNGAAKVRVQIRIFALYTPVGVVLKLLMAQWFGSAGVPWAMVLAYAMLILPFVYREAGNVLTPPLASET